MFRCWMVVALIAALWGDRAEAAELTGFGPIKFGMTKEQAEAALEAAGIEGEWKVGTEETWDEGVAWLEYSYPIRKLFFLEKQEAKLEITQYFEEGLANDTVLDLQWLDKARSCYFEGLDIVSAILGKYQNERIVQEEIDDAFLFIGNVSMKVYLIPFKNEAFIKMVVGDEKEDGDESKCEFWVLYHAPVPNPVPF